MHEKWTIDILPKLSKRGPRIARTSSIIGNNLEDLGVAAEDVAETLALAANDQFRQLVRQELDSSRRDPLERGGAM